jgi:hypothetical protein
MSTINIDNIFKDFNPSDASLVEKAVYGWVLPDQRSEPDKLEDFDLRPDRPSFVAGSPVPQLQRPTQYYFYKIFDNTPDLRLADEAKFSQFTVTYGNVSGDGSASATSNSPTQAIYEQYTGSALPEEDERFFPDSSIEEFYAINLNRRVQRSRIRPGAWELTLGYDDGTFSETISFIDKSVDDSSLADDQTSRQEIEVVPGTLSGGESATGRLSNPADKTYGYVYPDKGIIVLNPEILVEDASNYSSTDLSAQIEPDRGSPTDPNHKILFEAIDQGSSFRMQAIETVIEKTLSINVRQEEFNYSLNPTYSDSNGNITFPESGGYYTTVGYYNDNYQLLATAKIAEPQRKENRDTASVDVTLEF